jgi:tRNA A-37 threonylcarbamoyl transferase component Bud32
VTAVGEAAAARKTDPSAPRVRRGHFEFEQLIGCGGMGIVFRARDPRLDRRVALKLWNLDAERAELALRHEALCQAQISHPNVVTIYETGKIGADMYLAMEYVDGMDVRRSLARRSLLWQQTLALFIHAGRGLAAVHARGLVHGDFKPENVLLGRDGRVLVADFGLARAVGEFEGGGTRAYMAPERLEGRLGNEASDQFSLCVALWECLHGVRPFAGDTATELLAAMRAGQMQTGPGVFVAPEVLRRVLRKGLSWEPAQRYANVDALVRQLHAVPMQLRRRRRRWVLAGGVVSLGLIAALGRRPGTQDASAGESAHTQTKTTPEQMPTTSVDTRTLSGSELAAMIERGEFDAARARWERQQSAARMAGESSAVLSVAVAQAFVDTARKSADPKIALECAGDAMMVASSIPLEFDVTPEAAAAAERLLQATLELIEVAEEAAAVGERISAAAAELNDELNPIVEVDSKHSAVPLAIE